MAPLLQTDAETPEVVVFNTAVAYSLPLFWPRLLIQVIVGMMTVILPIQVLSREGSYAAMGYMVAAQGAGQFVSAYPAGIFSNTYGPKAMFMLAEVASIVGSLLCMVAPAGVAGNALLAIGAFLIGGSDGGGAIAGQTFVTATAQPNVKGMTMSTLGALVRWGSCIGPAIAGVVLRYYGPASVYALQALIGLVALLSSQFLMNYVPAHQEVGPEAGCPSPAASSPKVSVRSLIQDHTRAFTVVVPFCFCLLFIRRGRNLLIPMSGRDLDLPQDKIGLMVSLSYIVDGVLFPVAGWLTDNIGRSRTGALSCGAYAAAFLCLLAHSTESLTVFAVGSGLANGIGAGLNQVMASDLAPSHGRGQFLGLFRTASRVTELICPLTVGFLAQSASLSFLEIVMAGISISAVMWVLFVVGDTRPEVNKPELKKVLLGSATQLSPEKKLAADSCSA